MKNTYDLVVFIGRFQPFHNSHKKVIEYASSYTDNVLVLVGSSLTPRTFQNPFTFEERSYFIKESSKDIDVNVECKPIKDYPYNDNKWLQSINDAIQGAVFKKKNPRIAIIGHKKDNTSYYLDLFPNYDNISVPFFSKISATDIRSLYFEDKMNMIHNIPKAVKDGLESFYGTDFFNNLQAEYKFNKQYKKMWEVTPYPVNFVTTDVIFVCSGHVLMGERKTNPGKGLLALPGGFLDPDEYIIDSAIRELKEETKIDLPKPMLKNLVKEIHVFDNPNRSTRGRTITHAHFMEYNSKTFPKVKAADDLINVHWVPLNQLKMMSEDIFEDHLHIIDYFVNVID